MGVILSSDLGMGGGPISGPRLHHFDDVTARLQVIITIIIGENAIFNTGTGKYR